MGPDESTWEWRALMFFGTIVASVSHDIKNVLAVVNENAGLLGDLALMAERGLPLDPGRLKTIGGKIAHQVSRADGIVKNMNRFAHSVDHPRKQVVVDEVLDLLTALYRRKAAMRNVTVTLDTSEDAGGIVVSPFRLLHLLWVCLDHFVEGGADSGAAVDIRSQRDSEGVRVRYRCSAAAAAHKLKSSVSEQATEMAASLGGRVTLNAEGDQLDVMVPVGGS